MSPNSAFPVLEIGGSPDDRGSAHGEHFRDRITATWDFYREVLKALTDQQLEEKSRQHLVRLKKYLPALYQELTAISLASGLASWKLMALNARTELLQLLEPPPLECTTIFHREQPILAMNWDFAESLEKLTVIIQATLENGVTFLSLGEPGMLGKIGINSNGIAVSLNRLGSKRQLNGLPVHVLLRIALESSSIAEIQSRYRSLPVGSESAIIVADDNGQAITFEISGDQIIEGVCNDNWMVHANHYSVAPSEEFSSPDDVEHSTTRVNRACELLNGLVSADIEAMKLILLDRENPHAPICREYEPSSYLGRSGTISAIIMEPKKRLLSYTPGNPLQNAFLSVKL
jgi:isopenicillin-N N-acyltransferase like protein